MEHVTFKISLINKYYNNIAYRRQKIWFQVCAVNWVNWVNSAPRRRAKCLVWSKLFPWRAQSIGRLRIDRVSPPFKLSSRKNDAEEDDDKRHGDTTIEGGCENEVWYVLVRRYSFGLLNSDKNLLYLDHHALLRRFTMPLNTTLNAHQDEKLMPVAGGTRLMPPKMTGQVT